MAGPAHSGWKKTGWEAPVVRLSGELAMTIGNYS